MTRCTRHVRFREAPVKERPGWFTVHCADCGVWIGFRQAEAKGEVEAAGKRQATTKGGR